MKSILLFVGLSIIIVSSVNANMNICEKVASEFKLENEKVDIVRFYSEINLSEMIWKFDDKEYEHTFTENPSWAKNVKWLQWNSLKYSKGKNIGGRYWRIAVADQKTDDFHFVLIVGAGVKNSIFYSINLIPNEKMNAFIQTVMKADFESGFPFNEIEPFEELYGGPSFRNIFMYDTNFYFLGGDDWENNQFNITEIKNSSTKILCNFDNNVVYKENLTFLKLLGTLLNKVSGCGYNEQNQSCHGTAGDSSCNYHDADRYISGLITKKLKPWLLKKEDLNTYEKWINGDFAWLYSYSDIWTNRFYETLKSSIPLAKNELKKILIKYYDYGDWDAEKLANHYIAEALGIALDGHHGGSPDFEYKDIDDYNGNIKNDLNEWFVAQKNALKVGAYDFKKTYNFYWYLPSYSLDNTDTLSLLLDHFEFFSDKELKELTQKKNTNYFQKNLLMYTAHMNNYGAVKSLSEFIGINEMTVNDDESCRTNVVAFNRSALTYACENASKELISTLVQKGGRIDIKDAKGRSLNFYLDKNPYLTDDEKNKGLDFFKELRQMDLSKINPSFDPKKASNRFEKTICSSETLSNYDKSMSTLYNKMKSIDSFKIIKKSQKEWLKNLRNDLKTEMEEKTYKAYLAREIRNRTYLLQKIYEYTEGKPLF